MMRKLLYLLYFVVTLAQAQLPVDFVQAPSSIRVPVGQVQTFEYVIRNNTSQPLPIQNISIVNRGDKQAKNLTSYTTDCPKQFLPHASCRIAVTVNQPSAGQVSRVLSIHYGGRAALTATISFTATQAAYTVLVYIVATDLESRSGAATFNINQMMQVGSTNNMNVVIETGAANKVGFTTVQRKLVLKNQTVLLADLGRINMGLTSTIISFLEWGVTQFPADKYILIFWDHGGGPNSGFGSDELFAGSQTPINQLAQAVQTTVVATRKHFEIIGFDACLLGNIETYSGLYPYTNYLIGSEDLEPGNGWQYNTFLAYITSHPTANGLAIGKTIVDGYTVQNNDDSTTLSVVAAENLPSLLASVTQFATALSAHVNSTVADWKNIARARLDTSDYHTSVWGQIATDLVDVRGFANHIAQRFPANNVLVNAATALSQATQTAVKYVRNSENRQLSYGLTVYFPSIMQSYQTNYPSNTLLNGQSFFSSSYTSMVTAYYNYYLAQIGNLTSAPTNLVLDGPDYKATITNDYDDLYAAVGNDACMNVYNEDNVQLGSVPCYGALLNSNITATPQPGNTWEIRFNKASNIANWFLINNQPALLIALDTEPVTSTEISYLIPVTEVSGLSAGYLSIVNDNGTYQVAGFQASTGSSATQPKIRPITNGTQFYLNVYALDTTWRLLRTDIIVTAPFTITTGILPAQFNAFRFLSSDLTGLLSITNTSLAY